MDTPKPPIDQVKRQVAHAIIATESGKVIGQLRDEKSWIDNPGKIATFGGGVEGDETPLEAMYREVVEEETNLPLKMEDFKPFDRIVEWRPLTKEWEIYNVFTVTITDEMLENLEVYEGQGWVEVTNPNDEKIVDTLRPVFVRFFEQNKIK